jgi:hypothetical protein
MDGNTPRIKVIKVAAAIEIRLLTDGIITETES